MHCHSQIEYLCFNRNLLKLTAGVWRSRRQGRRLPRAFVGPECSDTKGEWGFQGHVVGLPESHRQERSPSTVVVRVFFVSQSLQWLRGIP